MSKSFYQEVILLVTAFFALQAPARAEPQPIEPPKLVRISSDSLFAPPGFDDNDNAQLVIQGTFINTCYKTALPEVSVDRATKQITIAPRAYLRTSCWCLQVLVPFTQTVDLGLLPAGEYRVVERDDRGRTTHETTLSIARSGGGDPDDFLYAPVKHAQLERTPEGKVLVLSGTFSSDCMDLREVKILQRVPQVIEVLPLARFKENGTCRPTPRPFKVNVALPATYPGQVLIHVRSLSGQAINEVDPFLQ